MSSKPQIHNRAEDLPSSPPPYSLAQALREVKLNPCLGSQASSALLVIWHHPHAESGLPVEFKVPQAFARISLDIFRNADEQHKGVLGP